MNYTPTSHQKAIFDFVESKSGNAIITAVAGSGKTTSIIESFNYIPKTKSVMYLVFNKRNADEAAKLVPSHVLAKTFHSVGYGAWAKYVNGKLQVSQYKCNNIMRKNFTEEENLLYRYFVLKLVSLAKNNGVGIFLPDEPETWKILINHFNVDLDTKDGNETRGIEIAQEVLSFSNAQTYIVDFDDMLYLPVKFNCTFRQFDFVFVDEAQDTNKVQREILKKMLSPQSRFIAVGDPYQAIYGFRGASSDAMSLIKEDFSCVELPLTVSFRCAKNIVKEALEFCPIITAKKDAEDGEILHIEINEHFHEILTPTDLIICRNTAPLIDVAYSLINNGVGCNVLGRDIGNGLITLIKKMNGRDIENLVHNLENFENREVEKFLKKNKEDRAFALQDKISCINIVINNLPTDNYTIEFLISSIKNLFKDQKNKLLTLCTIHKAKGLEAPRVFILERFKLQPSRWAKQDHELEQENNLIYVAISRAKSTLVYLSKEKKEKIS